MKKVFVIWAREVKLSEFLAKSLGAKVIVSYRKKWKGFNLPVVLRYLVQFWDTYRKLKKARPDVIFVQNPPIFAVLTVYIYTLFNKACYIIDTHTAGFLDKKWIFFHWLHKFLARRAILNTVHNLNNEKYLKKWEVGNTYVLQFYNPVREEILKEKESLPSFINKKITGQLGLKVFMVNRFASDDAWREVIETAKLMPEALFFLTGDYTKLKTIEAPRNVVFTGYINHRKFIKLMDRCDVVLALTKRKDTVLWSIREIMALNKPFVTTESEMIRHYFSDVALFSNMKPADLENKITLAWKSRFEIKGKIENFLAQDEKRWMEDIQFVLRSCQNAQSDLEKISSNKAKYCGITSREE